MKNSSITRSLSGKFSVLPGTHKIKTFGLLLLFFTASFAVRSQDLAKFMYASKKEGVNSIPYDDLFKQAGDLQGDKNAAHKALEGYSTSGLKTNKETLIRFKKEMEEDRKEAEKKLAADDKKSSSVTNNLKTTLANVIEEQKKLEGEITALNAKISDALEKRAAINRIRAEITKIYAKVDDKLDASLSNPTPHIGPKPSASDAAATKKYNADLAALKEYIATIKEKNEKGFDKHKTEIADSLAAENTLRDALALH